MKVLIATDGSKEAGIALRTASRLLSRVDRNLDLLCVAPGLSSKKRSRVHRNGYESRVMGEMTQILEQARACLPRNAGVINLLPEIGSPSGVIVDKAEDYDLTVIGPKGRGSTGEDGLGPVASRVVEHAMAPVLVARDLRSEGGVRVLVAVDGSTASLRAVETLTSLFDLGSAEVCLMYVTETPWVELGLEEDWSRIQKRTKKAVRRA